MRTGTWQADGVRLPDRSKSTDSRSLFCKLQVEAASLVLKANNKSIQATRKRYEQGRYQQLDIGRGIERHLERVLLTHKAVQNNAAD